MKYRQSLIALAWAAALATFPSVSIAQALEIAPVTIDLPAGRGTTTIRITNRGDQPTTIQMRPFAWTQEAGQDRLDAGPNLLLSPPFSTLKPGDTQTIRIVLRKSAAVHEDAYRMLIDQLPSAANPGSVQVALRVTLPIFAAPAEAVRPALTWRLTGVDPVKRTLMVRNTGTRRAKITAIKLGGAATVPGFTFRYVLAGSEAATPVEAGPDGWVSPQGSVHVSGSTDQGKVEADASIVPAA